MIIEVLLQVCKCTLNLIVRVGHPFTFRSLISIQVRQIIIQTIHRRSEPAMEIVRLAVFVNSSSIQMLQRYDKYWD